MYSIYFFFILGEASAKVFGTDSVKLQDSLTSFCRLSGETYARHFTDLVAEQIQKDILFKLYVEHMECKSINKS